MHYRLKEIDPSQETADCLVLAIFSNKKLSTAAEQVDKASRGYLTQILAQGDLLEELGHTLLIYKIPGITTPRVLLVYCGEEADCRTSQFRKICSKAIIVLKSLNLTTVFNYLTDISLQDHDFAWQIRYSIELIAETLYNFDCCKSKKNHINTRLQQLIFNLRNPDQLIKGSAAITQGMAITAGMQLSKDLANLPANIATPSYIAEQAQGLAKHYGLKIQVLEKSDIEQLGMGAFLAVARGSKEPPKFVVIDYQPTADQRPIVLIGKGITFDSGGLSLKPPSSMEEMKFDMIGAASVLGTLKVVAELQLPIRIIGLLPLTENLPSGTATKPGDIVTTLSGQTVEILNTDAEGRLVLADALSYSERFNPLLVIDIATLTGAIITTLGHVATGLMSNQPRLTAALETAGQQSEDRVWSLPLWEDYEEQIQSNVADIANVGSGGAKSITAACFLERFAKQFDWAHLDIAGTGWKMGKDKTATGRPIPLLVQFLLNHCQASTQSQ